MTNNRTKCAAANILVIDLSTNDKTAYLRKVCGESCHVIYAPNRAMLGEFIRMQTPDLILLSLQMSEGDAFGICKALRQNPRTASVPIIYITAQTDSKTMRSIFEHDGCDYITMPFIKAEIECRIRAHLQMRQKEQTLESRRSDFKAFCAAVSGELREPISAINMVHGLLKAKLEENDCSDMDECLEIIGSKASKTCRLAERIGDYAKVCAANTAFAPVNLRAIAEYAFGKLNDPARSISFSCPDIPWIRGDEYLISRMMTELIGNAVKFTKHTPQAEIRIAGKIAEDSVTVTVSDNGVGFNMEYAGKLFLPFRRMHTDAEYEGFGMGLAIVRCIMSMHGGTAEIRSALGKGTEVLLTFPRS